jgi:pectate lyase
MFSRAIHGRIVRKHKLILRDNLPAAEMKSVHCLKFIAKGIATRFKSAPVILALAVSASQLSGQSVTYEGYGFATIGGQGGDTYHVTTLADGGSGSLRDGAINRAGPRTIVFDVGGTITITNQFIINRPYLTIDGSTAPSPGITLTKVYDTNEFKIGGTHDIIVQHLRLLGLYQRGADAGPNNTDFMQIDGDSGPDHHAQNIVVDHITVLNATDSGMDIWGEVSDVTVSWCLIANSFHPSTVSFYPAPFQKRRRISMHHNVWARNDERNPQLRADVADFDYVNNIIYDWGYWTHYGYGIRIKNDPGEPHVSVNFINNYFKPVHGDPTAALLYGLNDGADTNDGGPLIPVPQGTVITNSLMGALWVSGNVLPVGNMDHYSTIPAPNPVPTNAQVTTYSAYELRDRVVPNAGTNYRTPEEQAMFAEITSALAGPSQPKILSITSTNCVLEINTASGFLNDLQVSDSFTAPNWKSLTNFVGDGSLVTITDAPIGLSSRFYRVLSTVLP